MLSTRTTTSCVTCTTLRSDGNDEEEQDDDEVLFPESDLRSAVSKELNTTPQASMELVLPFLRALPAEVQARQSSA